MPTFAEKRLALEERAPRQDANMAWLEGSIELDRRAERAHQAPHLADHGCAFCIDMHWKRARAFREGEERLQMLDAWRESPLYDEHERGARAL